MYKCTVCGRQYPKSTLNKMVQIENKKAYLYLVCPACRLTTSNNPHIYPLVEEKQKEE